MKLNLPEAFIQQMKSILQNEYQLFEDALNASIPISIRTNNKTKLQLSNEGVKWCDSGYYLETRPLFTSDPLLHAGTYYVQEASSMFLSMVVKKFMKNSDKVLDLCAAPGGKSTLLASYLKENCLLVSNEINRQRAHILSENIAKWGNDCLIVTNNSAKDFAKLTHFFDAIVIDAPCSGEGMFRKDPNAIQEWSPQSIEICVKRQQEIISDCWKALKPSGIMVYSTCTYNYKENEENIKWICNEFDAEVLKLNKIDNDITETNEGYRFYPHKTKGEGFFLSVIQKKAETLEYNKYKARPTKYTFKNIDSKCFEFQLKNPENYNYQQYENKIFAFKKLFLNELTLFRQDFNCLLAGIEMFEVKGKDLIPTTQLALSKHIDRSLTTEIDVDYRTAINYLKRESIQIQNPDRGYFLITYNQVALGWIKSIGNRCNNLYPQHWRIRMDL